MMTFPITVLIIANLVPLAGAFFLNWDAANILLLYWAENLVVGFYTILKMAMAKSDMRAGPVITENDLRDCGDLLIGAPGGKDRGGTVRLPKLFSILFFCGHFSAFCGAHGFFLVMLLNLGKDQDVLFPSFSGPGPWPLIQMLFWAISRIWQYRPDGFFVPLICLFLSHGSSFIRNYLLEKEYLSLTVSELMVQPYKRIMVLHLTMAIGASLILSYGLNSSVALLSSLVVLKIGMDIWLHIKEHEGVSNRR